MMLATGSPAPGPSPRLGATDHVAGSPDFAESIISGLLTLVLPSADLRKRLGIVSVSPRPDGHVGWYLWFAGDPGAHELALLPAAFWSDDREAVLALRYYPAPDADGFDDFSPIERDVRTSELFDDTGTPRFGRAGDIDPALFHVATLTLSRESESSFGFVLSTQDRWRTVEHTADGPLLRRAVPGLEFATPLLRAVVRGSCFLGRHPPGAVRVYERPGMLGEIAGDGSAAVAESDELRHIDIAVHGLVQPGLIAETPPVVPAAVGVAVFDHSGSQAPTAAPAPIEALWWAAARWRFMPVGTFCAACAADDAIVTGRDGDLPVHTDDDVLSLDDLSEAAL